MNVKGSLFSSVLWWIVLGMVLIGVVLGVVVVHGKKVDVRPLEADILHKKIISCLVEDGVITEEVFSDDFSVVEYCEFNFKDVEEGQQYFIELTIYDSCEDGVCDSEIYRGGMESDGDLRELCGFIGKTPYCYGGRNKQNGNLLMYVLRENGDPVFLDVFILIAKIKKNVT